MFPYPSGIVRPPCPILPLPILRVIARDTPCPSYRYSVSGLPLSYFPSTQSLKSPTRFPNHFGNQDSPIYKIRDRNKNNGNPIHHGLRCMWILGSIRIDLAPYPWL